MSNVLITVEFESFVPVDEVTKNVELALVRALNLGATRGRTNAAKAVRDQVRFPASYLSPSQGRIVVSQKAKRGALEAIISGRDRATSLARFAKNRAVLTPQQRANRAKRGNAGVAVSVAADSGWTTLKRAFVIRLNNDNLGLAIRTDGEKPVGSHKPKPIGKNLWLLYGPSVDQVLMSAQRNSGVFEEMEPEILEIVQKEFDRQLALLENTDA